MSLYAGQDIYDEISEGKKIPAAKASLRQALNYLGALKASDYDVTTIMTPEQIRMFFQDGLLSEDEAADYIDNLFGGV
jgi:hypothetical protein